MESRSLGMKIFAMKTLKNSKSHGIDSIIDEMLEVKVFYCVVA